MAAAFLSSTTGCSVAESDSAVLPSASRVTVITVAGSCSTPSSWQERGRPGRAICGGRGHRLGLPGAAASAEQVQPTGGPAQGDPLAPAQAEGVGLDPIAEDDEIGLGQDGQLLVFAEQPFGELRSGGG